MSDDAGLVPLDTVVLRNIAAAIGRLDRFTNGVWCDRPWRYVPWRAWVYREPASFDWVSSGSGLVEIQQQVGIEACFPFAIFEDHPSDLEALGAELLAQLEFALLREPEFAVNAETVVLASNAHELPERGAGGEPLARAVLLIKLTYSRGYGDPYAPDATAR